jgi:putative DNA primase/helicase
MLEYSVGRNSHKLSIGCNSLNCIIHCLMNGIPDLAGSPNLAGLLGAVSTALASLAIVRLAERPSMTDFSKWVSAAEPALGWTQGAFLEAYAANRESGDRMSVEGNPVGLAILKLVQEDVRWSGTMTELKTTLRNRYPLLTDDPYSFPRQENKLSAAIRRIIPPLRRMWVVISVARLWQTGERMLRI